MTDYVVTSGTATSGMTSVDVTLAARVAITREFPVELEPGDGRTIDARIVPYNTPTTVADKPGMPYTEEWLPGVFERQARAVNRVKVWLNFEHDQGLRGIVGHGVSLEERPDALHGVFRVHENADGDKALQLVRDGLLTGLSLEAVPLSSRKVGDVVQRVRAHLDKVSLCRFPAFKEAEVLAVRTAPVTVDLEPVVNSELDERLASLGVEPLTRIKLTSKPWDGSAARFTDEQYARSAVLDRGGTGAVKERYGLPVLEPDGTLNTNALAAAAGRIGQITGASAAAKASAARKLVRYYRMANMEPPASLTRLAGS